MGFNNWRRSEHPFLWCVCIITLMLFLQRSTHAHVLNTGETDLVVDTDSEVSNSTGDDVAIVDDGSVEENNITIPSGNESKDVTEDGVNRISKIGPGRNSGRFQNGVKAVKGTAFVGRFKFMENDSDNITKDNDDDKQVIPEAKKLNSKTLLGIRGGIKEKKDEDSNGHDVHKYNAGDDYNEFFSPIALNARDLLLLDNGQNKIEEDDEEYNQYTRYHYTPRDYYFFDEFYGIDSDDKEKDTDDKIFTKDSIDAMIQNLSDFLDKNNPCALNKSDKLQVVDDVQADGNDNVASASPDNSGASVDAKITELLKEIKIDLDEILKIRLSCNESGNHGNASNGNRMSQKNESVSNHTSRIQHTSTDMVKPTVTERVHYHRPNCWVALHKDQNPLGNSGGDFKNAGTDCNGPSCKDNSIQFNKNNNDDGNYDDNNNRSNQDIRSKERRDDLDRGKHWEGDDLISNCKKQRGPPRPCIDVFSQESVLSQLCTRMGSVENGNECMTSQLLANQKEGHDIVLALGEEIKELKQTVERLQKSCMFYAEAPLGSNHVRGYKVKLSQGEGFEPASGVFTAPYDGVYQVTVGYFKRVLPANSDEVINIMTGSTAIFRFRVEGIDQQRIFMTSLQSGQSLWLKTNVKLRNDVTDIDIDLIFFGAFLMK